MVMMQGILWKWTNYLSGWQPRWFILDYGVMSYYRSQEDVHLGCRGSVKMSCCEILINPTDQVRIDLKVPPENFMYLKATSPSERQKWLVALGTAKACLVDSNVQEQHQQMNSMWFLKDKIKELCLCRGIMLEQVHTIKASANHSKDTQGINEAVTLLSATCDTFVLNLDDIMEVIEDNLSTISSSPVATPRLMKPGKHKKRSASSTACSDSLADSLAASSNSPTSSHTSSLSTHTSHGTKNYLPVTSKKPTVSPQDQAKNAATDSSVSSVSPCSSEVSEVTSVPPEHPTNEWPTPVPVSPGRNSFFGQAPVRFEDVKITADGLIPTKTFLEACMSIVPVFDKLSPTAFAPVKMDIQGNIKKIETKYYTDLVAFKYLQNIVYQEVKSNVHVARNSATDALLWLKRALEFVRVFLSLVSNGEEDLTAAAATAYAKSLKRYHGWMVRGVFALAMKACPYYNEFIRALCDNENGPSATERQVLSEMTACAAALGKILSKLNHYYKRNKIDVDKVV